MLRHVGERGVGLFNSNGVVRFWRWGVVDKDNTAVGIRCNLPQEAIVGVFIAQDPAAAMTEDDTRKISVALFRTHEPHAYLSSRPTRYGDIFNFCRKLLYGLCLEII